MSLSATVHKEYSPDQDLDKRCDRFLKNANPIKPMINTPAAESIARYMRDDTAVYTGFVLPRKSSCRGYKGKESEAD